MVSRKASNSSIVNGRHVAAKQFPLRNLYGILTGSAQSQAVFSVGSAGIG